MESLGIRVKATDAQWLVVLGSHTVTERPSSGIAGWRGGWTAGNGSEGTRPALLPAGPVPERLITVAVARK